MKTKTLNVSMDTSEASPPIFTVTKIEQDQPTLPGEKVDPTRRAIKIYQGNDRVAALKVKSDAQVEMYR